MMLRDITRFIGEARRCEPPLFICGGNGGKLCTARGGATIPFHHGFRRDQLEECAGRTRPIFQLQQHRKNAAAARRLLLTTAARERWRGRSSRRSGGRIFSPLKADGRTGGAGFDRGGFAARSGGNALVLIAPAQAATLHSFQDLTNRQ